MGEGTSALSFPDKAMAVWGSGWLSAGLRGKGPGREGEAEGVATSPPSRPALNKLGERMEEVVCSAPVEEADFPDGAAGR